MSHALRRIAATVGFSVAVLGLSVMATQPAQAASDPGPFVTPPPISNTIQISQVSTQGPGGTQDEFVEIQNVQAQPLDISGWSIWACTATNQQVQLAVICPPPGRDHGRVLEEHHGVRTRSVQHLCGERPL